MSNMRLRRLDDRNFVIEKKTKNKRRPWKPLGYYGNWEDLCHGVITHVMMQMEPEGETIAEQMQHLHDSILDRLDDMKKIPEGTYEI